MGKLDDVDVLIEAIKKKRVFVFPNDDPAEVLQRQGKVILQAIEEAPAVDVAPVVHGRWERCSQHISKNYFRCSVCKTSYMDGITGAIAPEYGSRTWRFCPNCGAKMED